MTGIYTLDPRDEAQPSQAVLATRPASLDGRVLGLLSNNKPHSEDLMRMIANIIGERYSLKEVVEYNKGGHQWPADPSGLEELARRCDVMIHATAE
jgi:hypothetical protein